MAHLAVLAREPPIHGLMESCRQALSRHEPRQRVCAPGNPGDPRRQRLAPQTADKLIAPTRAAPSARPFSGVSKRRLTPSPTHVLTPRAPRVALRALTMPKRVFITVAEVSGDQHAAQFIRALKQLDPSIIIEGFGGPEMAAAGAQILYETTTKAAMTLHGVKRVFEVSRLLKQARRHYRDAKVDL